MARGLNRTKGVEQMSNVLRDSNVFLHVSKAFKEKKIHLDDDHLMYDTMNYNCYTNCVHSFPKTGHYTVFKINF